MSSDRRLTCAFPVPLADSGTEPPLAPTNQWEPLAYQEPVAFEETIEHPAEVAEATQIDWSRQAARPVMSSLIEESEVIAGRYRIEERIGAGGMGRVYRVRHLELGKIFALKIMRSSLVSDEHARLSFFREARLASTLSHPHIVSVVDYG
jgi:hypothetical protein